MKAIILAAGPGSRLGKYTKEIPKALVEINGKSLVERQISLFKKNNIDEIYVVRGDKKEKFSLHNVKFIDDNNYQNHEQLGSLIAAKHKITGDVIISFSDIIFEERILHQFLSSNSDISIAVDRNWQKSYEERLDNPIELAGKVMIENNKIIKLSENLALNAEKSTICEFLGIVKLSTLGSKIFLSKYNELEKNHVGKFNDAVSFQMAKLTDILEELIKSQIFIEPIFIQGKWCEVDTPKDLERAKKLFLNS